jgi:ABC-type multidrug transport system fused ATPase/permease subunit
MKEILYFVKRLHSYSGKIIYFNLIGMVIASLVEGIGVIILIPLINLSGVLEISSFGHFGWVISFFQEIPKMMSLTIILSIYVLVVICQTLLQRNVTIRNIKIQQGYSRHLRMTTYSAILDSKWEFFLKKRKSDLINLMTSEIARVSGGINLFLQLLASLIFTVVQICFAIWISGEMTLFVLSCGFILSFFSKRFIKKSKALGNKTSLHAQSFLAGITDQLNGIKDIKSNSLENSYKNWLANLTDKMNEEQIEYTKLSTLSQLTYKIFSAVMISIFIFLSISMFKTNVEQLIIIIIIFSRLWPRFIGIQSNLEHIASTIPAFESVLKLQGQCRESREQMQSGEENQNIQPSVLKQYIEVRDVYFRYENKSSFALEGINMKILANRMTAIVGPSGAGKSTLVDLLMGLMIPENGEVTIDGIPIGSSTLRSYRNSISYVSQDPFLFNGTIKENLMMLNRDATEEQLWEALDFAACKDFVCKLPKGIDTEIGDRGIRLSGGERQRLILARAILRNPSILVLDEATSSLDTENEKKIQEAIEKLKGKMTIIVIAHRLSTIRNADQVIVMDNGKVIQVGEFDQLANKRGMFNNLLGKQLETAR